MKVVVMIMMACLIVSAQADTLVLRTAAQDSKPKYMRGEGGHSQQIVGMCIDIMRAVERVDPGIEFVGDQQFMPFRRIASELQESRLDVFFGMIKTEERKERYRFVETPLYPTRNMMAVRIDDPVDVVSFEDVRALGRDGVILVADGTAHYDQLGEVGGLILDAGARTVEQNIIKLLANRGRFVYSSDKNFESEFENHPAWIERIRILPAVFMVEYQFLATRPDLDDAVFDRLSNALLQLQEDGTLQEIFSNYVSF